MRRALIYLMTGSLFAQIASPALAQRRGATGPRGGQVQRAGGARRGATTYHGPRGGTAARAYGPRGSVGGVRGPHGGTAGRAYGAHGSVSGVRGPYGGGAAHVRQSYNWGGRHYYRPAWNTHQIYTFGRGFAGYPGWRPYHSYGLAPGLAAFGGLAFLSAGLLIGSYAHYGNTVYVYVVNEGGQNVEYRVDSAGNILSARVLGPA
jgi:hypothetical protein